MKTISRILCLFFLSAMCGGCGGSDVNEGENYGDILTTDQGLVLTQPEHSVGWGNSDCTMCHNLDNIHLVDRTGVTDIAAVHDQAINDGIAGCATCHGTNGVQ